jgi:ATP-binding cassette subfamily F protein uup
MDRIVDHVLAFEGEGKIKEFVGNFSEYRESQKSEDRSQKTEKLEVGSRKSEETSTPLSVANQQPITSNQQPKKKLSFKEQRELETIEKEMPKLEEKRAEILEQLNNESDYDKISKLSSQLETISEKLEEFEMRWLELQE